MSLPLVAIFLGSFGAVLIALRLLSSASGWEKVEGAVVISRIEEEYHNPSSKRAESRLLNYHVVIAYDYRVAGEVLRGERVLPVLPAIFSRRDRAEELQARFPVGAKPPVYFRPGNPQSACLIPDVVLGTFARLAVAFVAAMAVTLILSVFLLLHAREAASG